MSTIFNAWVFPASFATLSLNCLYEMYVLQLHFLLASRGNVVLPRDEQDCLTVCRTADPHPFLHPSISASSLCTRMCSLTWLQQQQHEGQENKEFISNTRAAVLLWIAFQVFISCFFFCVLFDLICCLFFSLFCLLFLSFFLFLIVVCFPQEVQHKAQWASQTANTFYLLSKCTSYLFTAQVDKNPLEVKYVTGMFNWP